MNQPYKRVLLKLSGEVFGGGKIGVDPAVVSNIARQVAEVANSGVQVAIVVGGGNFFRGAELSQNGMERERAERPGREIVIYDVQGEVLGQAPARPIGTPGHGPLA